MMTMVKSDNGSKKLNDLIADNNIPDHDILLTLYNDMKWIKRLMDNHLDHHRVITLALITSLLAALGGLILVILEL